MAHLKSSMMVSLSQRRCASLTLQIYYHRLFTLQLIMPTNFFGQVELEDPVENIGAKLVRQAAAKTNDLAGDGTTTSVVLAQGMITEGVKVHQLKTSCLGAYVILAVLHTHESYSEKCRYFPRL